MENLIVVKQLPIIEEHLKALSDEIDKKVERANALICNEDTVKEVKKVRTELNNNFKELEEQRKIIKNQVLKPYNEFEDVYKKYVSDKFKSADGVLKGKIDDIETKLKAEKEEEVKQYFDEYREKNNISFVNFSRANIKVGLSDSMKSLKEKAKNFVDKVIVELQTIETQQYKDEILVEYMKTLDINQSIKDVLDRHFVLDQVQKQKEEQKQEELKKEEVVSKVEKVTAPTEESKIYHSTFTIYGTLEQIKKVKNYLDEMKKEGLRYE